jgi:uncharacterized damage-inducible protein DinB
MMNTFFKELVLLFQNLHSQMEEAFLDLPQEGLDWIPGEEMNSISVLTMHTAGATRFLVGEIVLGLPSERDREAEFNSKGVPAEDLQKQLRGALKVIEEALDQLDMQDLEAVRTSPRDGRELTVGWCIAHAFEHTAQHLGHMQMTRQMWEQKNI